MGRVNLLEEFPGIAVMTGKEQGQQMDRKSDRKFREEKMQLGAAGRSFPDKACYLSIKKSSCLRMCLPWKKAAASLHSKLNRVRNSTLSFLALFWFLAIPDHMQGFLLALCLELYLVGTGTLGDAGNGIWAGHM